MIPVASITFTGTESGIVPSGATFNTTPRTTAWAKAERALEVIAAEIKARDGHCCKIHFAVTWADGESYTGRLDLLARHADERDRLPAHMTQYLLYVMGPAQGLAPAIVDGARQLLAGYELPGEVAAAARAGLVVAA